jgi:23S rRNA pseudoU1915 N3-methylase RlmH
MKLFLLISSVFSQEAAYEYEPYEYDYSYGVDSRNVDSPFDRVLKIGKQSRSWIADYANDYHKKFKLERSVNRFELRWENEILNSKQLFEIRFSSTLNFLRYQNALDHNGCRQEPSRDEERELDFVGRGMPATAEGKIQKFHKLLTKFHKLYLTDCKKATRLQDVADRFKVRQENLIFVSYSELRMIKIKKIVIRFIGFWI